MNFDSYGEFEDWCVENGYDADNTFDEEEESHERDTWGSFYILKESDNTYAHITCTKSYDYGWSDVEVQQEGLTRKVTQVVTEKVEYI